MAAGAGAATAGTATPSGVAGAPAAPATAPVLVFAAASLSDVLEELDRAFTQQTGIAVQASYAASSVLAKQIEAGAAAELFFSADLAWVDYLEQRSLLKPGSRHDVLGNDLVLIAPSGSTLQLKIAPGFDLAGALGAGGRLALADPDSVPAGRYAHAALSKLAVWDGVAGRLARAENVRATLAYVARGETPLGIVYGTDARAEKRVRVIDVFPADTHPPITYPMALTVHARPQAGRLADFLGGAQARQIFVRYGFTAPPAPDGPASH
jgi:molybdate transport system substrate-binding protein